MSAEMLVPLGLAISAISFIVFAAVWMVKR